MHASEKTSAAFIIDICVLTLLCEDNGGKLIRYFVLGLLKINIFVGLFCSLLSAVHSASQ